MKPRVSRTAIAAALIAVALGVPCVAWYVSGARETERQARQIEESSTRIGRETADQLAARLASRLEALLEREARRPYYQYQSLYHDPAGVSQGISLATSPLARGPDDPLVLAHFQVDAAGRITLPTLDDAVRGRLARAELEHQQQALARLSPVAKAAWAAAEPPPSARKRTVAPADEPLAQVGVSSKIERLERTAYAQNVNARDLYQQLQKAPLDAVAPGDRGPKVTVEIGALRWVTLGAGAAPSLVAIRPVAGPGLRVVQGFALDSAEVTRSLESAVLPASFVPGTRGSFAAPVAATGWSVVTSSDSAEHAGRAAAAGLRMRFRRLFAAGAGAALLAGFGLIGLVAQAERLARRRSRFAAAAAHELRTPLAGLRMYGEMLADGLGDPERARDYARAVAGEAERLGRVVANVLGLSRWERGTLRLRPEPGDLGVVLRAAVERQRPVLEAAGASVSLEVAPGLPAARFDADAVHQIVQNLLDNAERYSRGAGERTIRVSLNARGDRLAITVADRGPGLPARARRRLFELRAVGDEPQAESGLGLGLPLVRALAVAMDGDVSCEDEPGGGARFTLFVPVSDGGS